MRISDWSADVCVSDLMESVPDAYVAALVSFTVSSALLLSTQFLRRPRPSPRLTGRPSRWFVGSGVTMALAIVVLTQALLEGSVVVVVPVVSAAPVFTLLTRVAVFCGEPLSGRLVAAVLVRSEDARGGNARVSKGR